MWDDHPRCKLRGIRINKRIETSIVFLREMNKLVPLLLDGTVLQLTGVDGFDERGLDYGNVDLALACSDHAIDRFGRDDPD